MTTRRPWHCPLPNLPAPSPTPSRVQVAVLTAVERRTRRAHGAK